MGGDVYLTFIQSLFPYSLSLCYLHILVNYLLFNYTNYLFAYGYAAKKLA